MVVWLRNFLGSCRELTAHYYFCKAENSEGFFTASTTRVLEGRLTLSACADSINLNPTERQFRLEVPPFGGFSMKLAYFDCFSGISGDMTLGALVDAGCPVEHLRSELRGLEVPGWELSAEKGWKNGMAATSFKVKA